MWVLLATVCLSGEAVTCTSLVWTKESFSTEMECAEVALEQAPALNNTYTMVLPRCVYVPLKPNV
jgi:hypothetical protein